MVSVRQRLATKDKQFISYEEIRPPRHLANSDITKLLGDLDNQTEAIKNGQEIGEELLGENNDAGFKGDKLEGMNDSLFEEGKLRVNWLLSRLAKSFHAKKMNTVLKKINWKEQIKEFNF